MIIGFMGLACAGKDTAAHFLVENYNFEQISFAGSLKDATAAIFGWQRELLEGNTPESRVFRETEDEYWTKVFGQKITPRWVLQQLGTDVFRNWCGNIWISSVGKKISDRTKNFVLSDLRFFNEIEFLKEQGGFVVSIDRGPDFWPVWKENFDKQISKDDDIIITRGKLSGIFENPPHQSEWEHLLYLKKNPFKLDFWLDNDGSKQQLYNMIDFMMKKFVGPIEEKPVKNKSLQQF